MTKFKVGDRVRRIIDDHWDCVAVKIGSEWNIIDVPNDVSIIIDVGGRRIWADSHKFELVTTPIPLYSEEQAVSFLKEKGYSITPPPEALKGRAHVYKYKTDGLIVCTSTPWDNQQYAELIAIVDWVEGEGLFNNTNKE